MLYDIWKTNHDEFYDEPDLHEYCISEDDIVDQSYCAELLNDALDAIYRTGDIDALENALDGLANEFNSKGAQVQRISRGTQPAQNLFEGFTGLTRAYAQSIMNKGE